MSPYIDGQGGILLQGGSPIISRVMTRSAGPARGGFPKLTGRVGSRGIRNITGRVGPVNRPNPTGPASFDPIRKTAVFMFHYYPYK